MEKRIVYLVGVVSLVVVISVILLLVQASQNKGLVGEAGKLPSFFNAEKKFQDSPLKFTTKRSLFPQCELGKTAIDCTIKFADENLEKDVKVALNLPLTVPIRKMKMEQAFKKITPPEPDFPSLKLVGKYQNLTGLEFLTPLVSLKLDVYYTSLVPNLSPLGYLPNLALLYVKGDINSLDWFNQPSEDKIMTFPKLSTLQITYNSFADGKRITSIEPLSHLKELNYLNLPFHEIEDLSIFENSLASLKGLDLRFNNIKNVAPLLSLPYLEELDLTGNPLPKSCPKATHVSSPLGVKNFLKQCLGENG